ncbi:MAG: Lrp/AsnC family transcriptional regulator [Oscillospiraceae bacterium]|jgi:Lrp/AsnC family leucine-responsive transcriptional regulator|nr:Lrp/AsnC family transcriptional regulator [Oscillospiraceae bacterium]
MDEIDYKILKCLRANARQKAKEISKRVSLSVSSVLERIKKMEISGVIKKYTAVLDQKLLGNDIMAIITVRLEHPKYYDEFTEMARQNENISVCFYLTGDYDFILKVFAGSTEELELVHRRIKYMRGVSETRTYIALKEIKNEISALPDFPDE